MIKITECSEYNESNLPKIKIIFFKKDLLERFFITAIIVE